MSAPVCLAGFMIYFPQITTTSKVTIKGIWNIFAMIMKRWHCGWSASTMNQNSWRIARNQVLTESNNVMGHSSHG